MAPGKYHANRIVSPPAGRGTPEVGAGAGWAVGSPSGLSRPESPRVHLPHPPEPTRPSQPGLPRQKGPSPTPRRTTPEPVTTGQFRPHTGYLKGPVAPQQAQTPRGGVDGDDPVRAAIRRVQDVGAVFEGGEPPASAAHDARFRPGRRAGGSSAGATAGAARVSRSWVASYANTSWRAQRKWRSMRRGAGNPGRAPPGRRRCGRTPSGPAARRRCSSRAGRDRGRRSRRARARWWWPWDRFWWVPGWNPHRRHRQRSTPRKCSYLAAPEMAVRGRPGSPADWGESLANPWFRL